MDQGIHIAVGALVQQLTYILMDVSATSLLQSCQTLPMDDLNTSDHLPIVASIECSVCTSPAGCSETKHVVDWEGSRRLSLLECCACRVGKTLSPSPDSVTVTAEQLDKEISRFTLVDVAKK